MSTAVRTWLTFVLVLVGAYGSYSFWRAYQAHAASVAESTATEQPVSAAKPSKSTLPPVALENFTFTDSNGEPFPMKNLEGKVWAASYFFATCPGFCLQMNYEIVGIAEDLRDLDITFVSFTVDPETDTPAELKAYAAKLKADPEHWKFLTGDPKKIQEFGQGSLKMPATKEHNDKLVLVGADGRVVGWYSTRDSLKVKQFKRKVRELLSDEAAASKGAEKRHDAQGDAS